MAVAWMLYPAQKLSGQDSPDSVLLQRAAVDESRVVSGGGSWLLSIGFLLPLLDPSLYFQFKYCGLCFQPEM